MKCILDGSIIGERNGKRKRVAMIGTFHRCGFFLFLCRFHKQVGLLEFATPSEQLYLFDKVGSDNHLLYFRIIHAVDQLLGFGEQVEFLTGFLCPVDEILIVGLADVGEHANGRTDDIL